VTIGLGRVLKDPSRADAVEVLAHQSHDQLPDAEDQPYDPYDRRHIVDALALVNGPFAAAKAAPGT
jgi:hypothetical protein